MSTFLFAMIDNNSLVKNNYHVKVFIINQHMQ